MEVNATAMTNPDTVLNSARAQDEQAVVDERRRGEARREDAQADPGPGVGKVVDISA